jgi:UDP-N-acetylglucosamine--N-acetylmuramyl-(pentapeptide) pyrophosphoryl-undecaprenol N-acetylglucosamine transferase
MNGGGKEGRGKGLRLCLAGSGGGHVRQLLDLEPVWSRYNSYFVTEDSALGASIARDHRAYFVDHYTLGQLRLGHPWRMARAAFRNFFQTLAILRRERPDVIITTGAGAMFWTALLGRMMGARIILIDSFARFVAPSKFARMVRPFAHHVIAQSEAIRARWPNVLVFDPFRRIEAPRPPKRPLLLATVGATLPFDRMSEAVVGLVERGEIAEEVVLQTGDGSRVAPGVNGLRAVPTLAFDEMKALLRDADLVVTHGGSGSLITALREGCRVVAMPRQFEKGEIYDHHQTEIVTAFAERGLIEVALEADELGPAIERARRREPAMATTDPSALIVWLDGCLAELAAKRG